ncbi:MAG: glycogen synthase GlgA [Simkaniaceae bacterium]
MKILHISPELASIAKVGGLADVVFGLSKEFLRMGHFLSILLPKYNFFEKDDRLKNLQTKLEFSLPFPFDRCKTRAWTANYEGIPLYLLEIVNLKSLYSDIYSSGDEEKKRFLIFSKAAAEFLIKSDLDIDVIHLHDWPTAVFAPLWKKQGKKDTAVLLTMHNLQYQGHCSLQQAQAIIDNNTEILNAMKESYDSDKINLLKGGILYADMLTTVSPTYAEEIQHTDKGYGLEKILQKKNSKLHGILNGIDYHFWNPETDPFLFKNFPTDPLEKLLEGKKENRFKLLEKLQMKEEARSPLFACISRMVYQKGPEMIIHAVRHVVEKGGKFILLGSPPEPHYKGAFEELSKELEGHPRAYLHFNYNEALAHRIYASSDFLLIPSIFEPCGLTQMIALRYGSLPIVRSTGGLSDTIRDGENGLAFEHPEISDMMKALNRAFQIFAEIGKLHDMIRKGSKCDYSWKASAKKYLQLYKSLMSCRKNR